MTQQSQFALLGKNPITALGVYFIAPLTDGYSLQEIAVKATPLVMIAIGLSLCYLANAWNIGAEGQFLIGAVAGLAMVGVLLTAFQQAFSAERGHQFGAFVALIVAMSDMKLLSISAPFWALLLGVLASYLADRMEVRRTTAAQT